MRRDLWLGLIGLVMLAGCEKPKVEPTEAPVTEAPVQATPPPAVVQATPESAPPAAQGAPKVDDEVYLVRRFSIPIDGGMKGFREGTKVKVVSIAGDKVTVAGNDVQFDVQAADISVAPPAAPTAAPAAAAMGKPTLSSEELEKKKERNRITAEISNLQIQYNNVTSSMAQMKAKMAQLETKIVGKSSNSPEARARMAEYNRLMDAIPAQDKEARRLQKEIARRNTALSLIK